MIILKDKKECCGCTACVSACPKHCIVMCEDEEGFLYPIVDRSVCVGCGLCERVCPVINQAESRYPIKVYAAINPNEDIREKSSSGGIFTMLAEKTISDGGVVFGAKFDDGWNVVHGYTETVEGLDVFRGSKYVQSDMRESYASVAAFLKAGRKVLFSGTSCQIAGLHRFLRREYDGLLTVDVVCHGAPSPLVWRKYLEEVRVRPEGVAGKNTVFFSLNSTPVITGVEFRNKSQGWKKYGFSVSGHADNREACENSVFPSGCKHPVIFQEPFPENLFMKGFLKNIYLRPSCYACPAKAGKSGSDITLGDYWGIEGFLPEMDDDKGTSLVLLNTEKGINIFRDLKCKTVETTYERALTSNISIERSVECPGVRKYFYRKFKSHNDVEVINKAVLKIKPSFIARVKFNVKRIIGFF